MRILGRVLCLASLLVSVSAYGAVVPQRIVQAIDASGTTELEGNVPAVARRGVDLGSAPASEPLTELSLRFNMTAAQQTTLTQLLADQQNPASSRYHQWLTPEQFHAQFGLAATDIQKISDWLTSKGFAITGVARGGTFLRFSGTVGQAQAAFHTQMHKLSVNGETHISNITEPELPSAIAAVTHAITGLDDFKLKPHHREMTTEPDAKTSIAVKPQYTSAASGNHFIAPGDFYTIYDVNPLLTSGTTGTGITIAIMGQTDINLADIAVFRSLGGLPVSAPVIKLYGRDPGTSTSDLAEAELDVEWSGATAPGATILYVNSTNVISGSLANAIDDNLAPIISLSYGLCETSAGLSVVNSYNGLLQQANAQGQTVITASGDSGATDCDYGSAVASQGLAVGFPASMPSVTGVGGTMFNDTTGTYWSATNGANSGSAVSTIPAEVWNEDATAGSLSSGGGGASVFFPKPYWQVGAGVPADSARDVPDISFHAALYHDAYLICTPGFCVDGYKNSSGSHDIVGGTSVGAPAFAGLLALLEQKIGSRVGNANPMIYALANSSYYSSVFHDVTVGTNASPCTAGTVNCPAGGSIGYSAGIGYDLASGWGSLDVFNFVTDWPLVTPLVSGIGSTVSTTTLSGTPASVTQGTNIVFTATVAGSGAGTPTGTVQFLLDNVAQGAPVALVSGSASYTLATTSVSSGAHTMYAAYSGDASYAGSKGSFGITIVSSGVPDFTLTPSATSISVAGGSSGTVVFTVNGLNSFSGTVALSAVVTSVTNATGAFSPTTIALTNTKTAGTSTFTLNAYKAAAVTGTSAGLRPSGPKWYEAGSGVALAGLLLLMVPKRRRFMGALVGVISVGLFAVSGCGGGGSTSSTTPTTPTASNNTPVGTYTVTVTASGTSGATAVTHSTTLTVVVR